jgi:predicted site-specific integrase-resolvase
MESLWIGKSTEDRLSLLLNLSERNAESTLKILGRLERLEKTTEVLYAAASAADSIKILERKIEDVSSFTVEVNKELAEIIDEVGAQVARLGESVGELKAKIARMDQDILPNRVFNLTHPPIRDP